MALKKLCRCGKLIDYGKKYCDECEVIVEQQQKERRSKYERTDRYKENNGIYKTKQWKYARGAALVRDNYLCQTCLKLKKIKPAVQVHHIIEVKEDKSLAYALENLISECEECHELITATYRAGGEGKKDMQEYLRGLIKEWE